MDDKKRLNSSDREGLTLLYAVSDMMTKYEDVMNHLAKRMKYGNRDMAMVRKKLDSMVREILLTLPVEQLYTIKRHLKISDISIGTHRAGKDNDNCWVLDREEITTLVQLAVKGECMLCNRANGNGCELSRLLDELPVDVANTFIIHCKTGEI